MTNSTSEADLPILWSRIAAAGGKREREAIDSVFRETGTALDQQHLVPVITPDLAKKITSVRFAGNNMDDLSEGINPFVLIIADLTSPSGERAYLDAVAMAQDYDDLVAGTTAAKLDDIKTLKAAAKVQIPTNFTAARAMLTAFLITLASLFGPMHPQVTDLNNFVSEYTAKETFYQGRIQRTDGVYGPARLLRFVQLQVRAWFSAMESASTTAAIAAVITPNFTQALHKTNVGDMTWLPDLPPSYRLKPADAGKPPASKSNDDDKKKSQQVRNPAMNTRFDDFKTGIVQNKFNDIIKKVGAPPTVERGGKTIPMCASYHLRGNCFSTCGRKADHGPHSTDEDDALYEWCKRAFE